MPISREDTIYEIWKPVLGFEKYYLVSNLGNIYSIRNKRNLKIKINSRHKYCEIEFNIKGNVTYHRVHRLVAQAFIYNPSPATKTMVNHIDGNKQNNTVSNLEWVTGTENNIHAIKTGLVSSKRAKYVLFNQRRCLVFNSIKEIEKYCGICSTNITKMCKSSYKLQKGKFAGYTCRKFHKNKCITFNDYRKLIAQACGK